MLPRRDLDRAAGDRLLDFGAEITVEVEDDRELLVDMGRGPLRRRGSEPVSLSLKLTARLPPLGSVPMLALSSWSPENRMHMDVTAAVPWQFVALLRSRSGPG